MTKIRCIWENDDVNAGSWVIRSCIKSVDTDNVDLKL